MVRIILAFICVVSGGSIAAAQTMTISTTNADYQVTNVFSDVDIFNFIIVVDAPLATGSYINPDIISITYQVQGALEPGTPSGFPAFNLQRTMTGQEFYDQGSSLSFEISPTAVLTDGVQIAELVGNAIVFTFNGREVDNGRFHPALFELNTNGTGRIQNSDNVPSLNPLNEVQFGEEYINDLMFDPGNTTLITGVPVIPPIVSNSGGGIVSLLDVAGLFLLLNLAARRRRDTVQTAPMYIQGTSGDSKP